MEKLYELGTDDRLSGRQYNAAIGVSLAMGLAVTAAATYALKDSIGPMLDVHPVIFCVLYLIVSLIASSVIASSMGTMGAAMGYVLLCVATGGLLSGTIPYIGAGILVNAAGATAVILVIMTAASVLKPDLFRGLGGVLLAALIGTIIAELLMMFLRVSEPAFVDWIVVGIFAVYIGYDWSVALEYPRTGKHAIAAAASLYLDLINIFVRLIEIMARSKSDD